MKPGWLLRHLEQTGRSNSDHIGRDVTAGVCRRCQAHVLVGLDDDTCALPVTVDPDPVDRVGEALALVASRRTVNVTRRNGRWQLQPRCPERIRGPNFGVVLAEHACHSPPLPTAPQPPQVTRPVASQEPPF